MNKPLEKPAVQHDTLLMEVVQRFSAQVRGGENPNIETYAEQHPELAEMLRDILPAVQTMLAMPADRFRAGQDPHLSPDESLPRILGDFRILREIGRGGMGLVYEAEQISLRRPVALKILPYTAMLDARRLQRFKNEAHAAAMLTHPNIVSVFAIGAERSVHFYAMQLIDGQTLAHVIAGLRATEKGESNEHTTIATSAPPDSESKSSEPAKERISPSAELDLGAAKSTLAKAEWTTKGSHSTAAYYRSVAEVMQQACAAVDYAHQHGVIHRDIKPSNLMVDSELRVWVTDFGLAQIESDTQITMTGDILGTLRYMSPEQALANRITIDHRTDVYSLGATLYELLTLQPVVHGENREQMLRSIAFEAPRKPRKVRPTVPLDLETIALKALEKSPELRFQTAGEMAEELARFVRCEPIRVRPPNLSERLYRWSIRHPAAIASAMAVLSFIAITASIATALIWQANIRAHRAAADLKIVTEFQANLLENFDLDRAGHLLRTSLESQLKLANELAKPREVASSDSAPTVDILFAKLDTAGAARHFIESAILQPALNNLEKQFANQPLIDAQLRQALARLFSAASGEKQRNQAVLLQRKAFETRKQFLGDAHPDTLESAIWLGEILSANGLVDEALEITQRYIEPCRRILGNDNRITLMAMNNIATLVMNYDQAQATEYLIEAVSTYRRVYGEQDFDTITAMHNLCFLWGMQGRKDEAVDLALTVQVTLKRMGRDLSPLAIQSRRIVVGAFLRSGRIAEAAELSKRNCDVATEIYGLDSIITAKQFLSHARFLLLRGNHLDAEDYLRKANCAFSVHQGWNSQENGDAIALLVASQASRGEMDAAESLLRHNLASMSATDKTNLNYIVAARDLALFLIDRRKLEEAEELLRQCLEVAPQLTAGQELIQTATRYANIGMAKLRLVQGHHQVVCELLEPLQAEPFPEKWVPERPDYTYGLQERRHGEFLYILGKAQLAQDEFATAEKYLTAAYQLVHRNVFAAAYLTRDTAQAAVDLYTAWDVAEPGAGHDRQADEWRKKLAALDDRPVE